MLAQIQGHGAFRSTILTCKGSETEHMDAQPARVTPGLRGNAMADVQVSCINKQPRNNPHEGITHLGGNNGGWKWTRDQVVASINQGTNTFFTLANGRRVDVGVVNGPNGPYVRTHADGVWTDNLLALPECP
jgi:hypothetical protein